MKARTGKTYTQYQLEQMIDKIEKDYEKQWNDRLEEIRETTFEQVKVDMWAQFMSIAMATYFHVAITRGFLRRVEDGRRDGFFFRPPTFTVLDVFLAFAINS
jgi:hypothetical protein